MTLIERDHVPSEASLPTPYGEFVIRVFHEEETGLDHVAMTLGSMDGPDPVLVRLHSECLTGDVFGSLRCDCGPQLHAALERISTRGWGVVLYLRQEGRGIGLHGKIQAYRLQDHGLDTLDANLALGYPGDARRYDIAARMIGALGIREITLLSNNPDKVKQLESHGVSVHGRDPLVAGVGEDNRSYLETKQRRMGHLIEDEDIV